MSKALSQLLEKEVTRKEFLQFMATAIVALFGLSNFLNLLTNLPTSPAPQPPDQTKRHGFGSSRFGN